jgi:hypothetical protein
VNRSRRIERQIDRHQVGALHEACRCEGSPERLAIVRPDGGRSQFASGHQVFEIRAGSHFGHVHKRVKPPLETTRIRGATRPTQEGRRRRISLEARRWICRSGPFDERQARRIVQLEHEPARDRGDLRV